MISTSKIAKKREEFCDKENFANYGKNHEITKFCFLKVDGIKTAVLYGTHKLSLWSGNGNMYSIYIPVGNIRNNYGRAQLWQFEVQKRDISVVVAVKTQSRIKTMINIQCAKTTNEIPHLCHSRTIQCMIRYMYTYGNAAERNDSNFTRYTSIDIFLIFSSQFQLEAQFSCGITWLRKSYKVRLLVCYSMADSVEINSKFK